MAEWLEAAYKRYYRKMVSVAYRRTGDRSLAEDLVQEVFLQAVRQTEELKRHPNLEAWLMLTLRNLTEKELRRAREVPLDEVACFLQAEMPDGVEHILPPMLSEEDKRVILWRYRDRMGGREMANRLGISEAACRSRVFRALEKCRRALLSAHRTEGKGVGR